jgi:hypothetical protein
MSMENQQPKKGEKRMSLREFFSLGEVGGYFFRRKEANRPNNINIRMMHGINKISILVFLGALILWLVKRFFF